MKLYVCMSNCMYVPKYLEKYHTHSVKTKQKNKASDFIYVATKPGVHRCQWRSYALLNTINTIINLNTFSLVFIFHIYLIK